MNFRYRTGFFNFEPKNMYPCGSFRVSNFNFSGALRHLTIQKKYLVPAEGYGEQLISWRTLFTPCRPLLMTHNLEWDITGEFRRLETHGSTIRPHGRGCNRGRHCGGITVTVTASQKTAFPKFQYRYRYRKSGITASGFPVIPPRCRPLVCNYRRPTVRLTFGPLLFHPIFRRIVWERVLRL